MADALPLDRTTTPIPRTRLIGRVAEQTRACDLLLVAAAPLLTLTGAGGVGKTRLALAIAADVVGHFTDGVIWVDLAPIQDPALVSMTVAGALGIVPRPNRSIIEELARHLRPLQLLLLFDNCEHLLASVADVVSPLLATCPALQILAASRAPLRVRGEQVLPIDPLPLPAPTESSREILAQNAALRLFIERAQAARPTFAMTTANAPVIAAICRALDGLPLAIELAAARITILSPQALLAQMTDRLSVLRDGPRDAPARQQAIEAAIGWSYDLLSPADQTLFRRLAVFTGGFTLEAAEAMVGDVQQASRTVIRSVGELVDQSLIYRVDRDGEPRFSMLETIRAFALARLRECGEEALARNRHTDHFQHLVKSIDAWIAAFLPEPQSVLDQLELEQANLWAALAWLRDTGNASGVLELAGDLVYFWQLRGYLRDGRAWLEWGLAHDGEVDPAARANGQLALSCLLAMQYESASALALCEASLCHYRAKGNTPQIARAASHAAGISLDLAGPELTHEYVEESLNAFATMPEAPWSERARTHVQLFRGIVAKNQGDLPRAERYLADLVDRQRNIAATSGSASTFACWPLMAWAAVAHVAGDFPLALERYQASLDHAWTFREASCCVYALTRVASILAVNGRWQEAAWLIGAAESYAEKFGLAFAEEIWPLTRAFGLPQPWQGPEEYSGQARAIRTAVLRRRAPEYPPLPEAGAAELWALGRGMPIEDAVAYALTVDFDTIPSSQPVPTMTVVSPVTDVGLSPRQREILSLLCERFTDPEIAARLFISPRTVEGHVAQILDKLGVANRRDAAAVAAKLGLI